MSNGIDIQIVKENYQKLSEAELTRMAANDAVGLTQEAQQVLVEEIKRRNLDPNIINAVHAQNAAYTIEEVDKYCEILRNLSCPGCGTSSLKLNGTMTSEVMSFILFTNRVKKIKIGCPNCLDKANDNAITKSTIAGWWGIPWGPVRTIQAIILNHKNKKTNHLEIPNDYLRSFALSRVGLIEAHKNDEEKLRQIIFSQ